MKTRKTQPAWDFLCSASPFALQSYELSRLNHSANLRKEILTLMDQWIEENSAALLARWLLEQRERGETASLPLGPNSSSVAAAAGEVEFVSDKFDSRGGVLSEVL